MLCLSIGRVNLHVASDSLVLQMKLHVQEREKDFCRGYGVPLVNGGSFVKWEAEYERLSLSPVHSQPVWCHGES